MTFPLPVFAEDGVTPLGEIAMVLLTQGELQAAESAAAQATKRHGKGLSKEDEGYEVLYNNNRYLEVLHRATRSPANLGMRFFPSAESIGDSLSIDEITVLFNYYSRLCHEFGPANTDGSPEEFELWMAKVKQGGNEAPNFLDICSPGVLRQFLMYLARLFVSLPIHKSSSTSPLNEHEKSMSETEPQTAQPPSPTPES